MHASTDSMCLRRLSDWVYSHNRLHAWARSRLGWLIIVLCLLLHVQFVATLHRLRDDVCRQPIAPKPVALGPREGPRLHPIAPKPGAPGTPRSARESLDADTASRSVFN